MTSVFLFHRDFRTIDNKSLYELHQLSSTIIPIFIFTPDQIDPTKNPYYNETSVEFMINALRGIPHIQLFYGPIEDVLSSIFKLNRINHLGFNLDYTPYAKERTEKVRNVCQQYNINMVTKEDYTLLQVSQYRNGSFYKVFKPFYESVIKQPIPTPYQSSIPLSKQILEIDSDYKLKYKLKYDTTERTEALRILSLRRQYKEYDTERNIPSIETTHLSKHIKFGTVSIREVYNAFKNNTELARQIVWHDFYSCLMYFLPVSDTIGGGNVQHKRIKWVDNEEQFMAWCNGQTGFPIIDAGMRQMNETGWMHNRIRLLVSNFLSLVLKIDWRKGERYFAQKLVDYDVTSNNLNWQFSAQVGTDRNPFTRIYNPFTQSEKYDKECLYIKRWVKELESVPCKDIHKWYKKYDQYQVYQKPIVDKYSK